MANMFHKTELEITRTWIGNKNKPVVSICSVTYNHAAYIEETVDSFLMQETSFPFEIVIGEDYSTDATLNILKQYQQKYPNIVRLVTSACNVGGHENHCRTIDASRGFFIANCDGDDVFLDELKLQKYMKVMDDDPQLSFIFSPSRLIRAGTLTDEVRNQYSVKVISKMDLEWVLRKGGGFYPSSSCFFKRSVMEALPDWFHMHCTGDYPLAISAALKGKIGYLDEATSAYRIHETSMTYRETIDKEKFIGKVSLDYNKNLDFIEALFKENIIAQKMRKELLSKEDYIYFAKLLYAGELSAAVKGIFAIRFGYYYKLRLLLKLLRKLVR